MEVDVTAAGANPKWMKWTGWVLSLLTMPMFAMSAIMKLRNAPEVAEGFKSWPAGTATQLGIVELTCMAIYLIPQTAVLGAILLTGYLGGAVATHVQKGEWSHVPFPILFGVILWFGLFFRDPRVRALAPLRSL